MKCFFTKEEPQRLTVERVIDLGSQHFAVMVNNWSSKGSKAIELTGWGRGYHYTDLADPIANSEINSCYILPGAMSCARYIITTCVVFLPKTFNLNLITTEQLDIS